jgi:cobalt/nickel transport system permease protein
MTAHSLHRTGVAGDPASPIHRLDPRAKIAGLAGITVVAVSTPLRAWPAFAACALALAAIAALARVGPRVLWTRLRVILPVVVFVAVFIPFARGGPQVDVGPLAVSEAGLATFALVTAKAAIGALSAVLLGATTGFPDILHGLERLRVPRLLTVIAAFMYRYVFVIADEARRMRAALAARAYRPRHLGQLAALGRLVTALFLRSYERGERVYLAMLARGYRGAMPRLAALAFRRADVVFVAALAGALVPIRILAEVAA